MESDRGQDCTILRRASASFVGWWDDRRFPNYLAPGFSTHLPSSVDQVLHSPHVRTDENDLAYSWFCGEIVLPELDPVTGVKE